MSSHNIQYRGDITMKKDPLPQTGFVRLPVVLQHIPICATSWWNGVKEGKYPQPVKIGMRTTAWRAEEIRDLIEQLSNPQEKDRNISE